MVECLNCKWRGNENELKVITTPSEDGNAEEVELCPACHGMVFMDLDEEDEK